MSYGEDKVAHTGGCTVSVQKLKQVFVRFAWKKVIYEEIARISRVANLNRGFVPMQTFPHLNGDPIKKFQWECSMVLEVCPILCIPMAVKDPHSHNRILDTLVCHGFQVLGGMYICE